MFIKVWCEYDIAGEFGGNNNEDVFEVDDFLTEDQVNRLVLDKVGHYIYLEDAKDEADIFDTGILGWSYIDIVKL